ncbi:MAG TPA: hypothetical protein VLO29_07115 [Salegentibacter sp.]|nr:hypothetical protein [Salegentibacter sp.]
MIFADYCVAQEKRKFNINTIAFYNVENLFDTENHPFTFDDDRTPEGKDVWTKDKYQDKLKNISKVIAEIGKDVTGTSPTIIGLCEVENRGVLEDLLNEDILKTSDYGIVHFDSPDRRGIDVALLYKKSIFKPTNSQSRRLMIYDFVDPEKRVYTRDQLVVSGLLDGEKMHFLVNHWPSRSGGEARSSYKREKAAALSQKIIDSLFQLDPYSKIISMGDFNDDPTNRSLKEVLDTKANPEKTEIRELYNPMEKMLKQGLGTLAYRDGWNLFDQIILTGGFLQKDYSKYQFYKAGIFNKNYLHTPDGQYKGYPFRSYGYGGYVGGYSDHFPVYIYLIKELP